MHIVLLAGAFAIAVVLGGDSFAASTIYYCPDRKSDQQYSAEPTVGCMPLVEKTQEVPKGTPQRDYQVANLQHDVSAFLSQYHRFLTCCKMDLNEVGKVEELADDLDHLLRSTQANLSNYSLASRGIMLRELMVPVMKARADLKILRARLNKINHLSSRTTALGLEEEARELEAIRELEQSIERDIRAPQLPGSAKTGASIGVAPAAGPAIGRSPKTGTQIGQEGVTGHDIGVTPTRSRDIGGSGLSGFEIGTTGRPGTAIGESTLNQDTSSTAGSTLQRSTVGSSLSDSTVGSSINSSTIRPVMEDIGSSLRNSSRDYDLQNR